MNIIYPHTLPEPAEPAAARHVSRRGGSFTYDDALVVEHTMEILINEQPAYQVVCSPTDLPQLVLGRLLSEGIIHSRAQVETIYLCGAGAGGHLLHREPHHCGSVPGQGAAKAGGKARL